MDLVLEAFDGEGGVVTTEAKAVAEDSVDFPVDADVGSIVEIQLGIRMMVVDGRWNYSVSNHHRADDGLDCAVGPQHVACCRLGRADVDILGSIGRPGLV